MKLLLTSGGVRNTSIRAALDGLLGRPIAECNALCIPTAIHPFPGSPAMAHRFITGAGDGALCGLGWKSLGVLELTALPGIRREHWTAAVEETDALLVNGGDPLYLRHWMLHSGLATLMPGLRPELVYVGVSAGSMAVAAHIGEVYPGDKPAWDDDIATEEVTLATAAGEPWTITFASAPGLGLADFALFPHLGNPDMPDTAPENVAQWAARLPVPLYGMDDQTALKVVDGAVEVVSEGRWQLFER
jgi:dipeptidase E